MHSSVTQLKKMSWENNLFNIQYPPVVPYTTGSHSQ